jgi:hypothetical protein
MEKDGEFHESRFQIQIKKRGLPQEPGEAVLVGRRSRSEVREPCRLRRGERYGACGDAMLEFEYAAILRDRIVELKGEK